MTLDQMTAALDRAGVRYSVHKGRVYYHSVDDHKAGQRLVKKNQAYNKYGNNKVYLLLTVRDAQGLEYQEYAKFDSEDEADRYFCLLDKYEAGEIVKLERQPRLVLIPRVTWMGRVVQQAVTYTPDFYVEYRDGHRDYEDVKGYSTQQGDLRRKIYIWLSMTEPGWTGYGIPLRWLARSFKYGDADGWIDYDELEQIRAHSRRAKGAA